MFVLHRYQILESNNIMSFEFILRLIGMVIFAYFGIELARYFEIPASGSPDAYRLTIVVVLSFSAIGLLLTPWITIKPFNHVRNKIRQMPVSQLTSAVIGMIIGLAISALLTPALSALPQPFSQILPLTGTVLFAYLGVWVMAIRHQDIYALFELPLLAFSKRLPKLATPTPQKGLSTAPIVQAILVDSSVIIDGRIADIAKTGFIMGTLLVPRFILNEIQHVSDSSDQSRRKRGRHGLEVLSRLQEDADVDLRIIDKDVPDTREADSKLVTLASQLDCPIMTTDYNLNKVAKLQGISVLNINELANSVKSVYLPGEGMNLRIIQDGTEPGQGVGFLKDGTMVVVQGGARHMNRTVDVNVTKVLQTSAGRMIFANAEI